jgi:hypothetical protein
MKINLPPTLNPISILWFLLISSWRLRLLTRSQRVSLLSVLLGTSLTVPVWAIPTITIDSPPTHRSQVTQPQVTVQGTVTATGGGQGLDLMLVLDDSGSLGDTDPQGQRFDAVRELLLNFASNPNVRIGLVFFTDNASLSVPLTPPSAATDPINNELEARQAQGPGGGTAIDAGINVAALELSQNGRPDASDVILLFSDGMSNDLNLAINAAEKAKAQDAIVSVIGLGEAANENEEIADAGGGSFLSATDTTQLNDLFSSTRIVGIDTVSVTNKTTQQPATELTFSTGVFNALVDLQLGENVIEITATDLAGLSESTSITVIRTPEMSIYQSGRLGVDYLTLDELPTQNVTVCVPPRQPATDKFTGLIADTLWIAVDSSQAKTVKMSFMVSKMTATDEDRVLFLVYSPSTSPSPQILTTERGPALGVNITEYEILGFYLIPALSTKPQTPTKLGLADPTPTTKVTVNINFDQTKIDEMIRLGKETIYVQAALIRMTDLRAGLYENMILSEMDALIFVANDCPAGVVEAYQADELGKLTKIGFSNK